MKKKHGGYRPNSGRKSGWGKFGEKTVTVRIPHSLKDDFVDILDAMGKLSKVGKLKEFLDYVKLQVSTLHN